MVCRPSRFLEEIDPEFVDRHEISTRGRGRPRTESRDTRENRGSYARYASDEVSAPSSQWDSVDHLPSYEEETQEASHVRPGMRVMHPSWGEGVVEAVEGKGENLKFTIRFRGGIMKKVLAIYAKLELLG